MQVHVKHDFALPACKAGHTARHIHDRRCLRAGGGHFVECACSRSGKFLEFDLALAEWSRRYAKRIRRRAEVAPAGTVLQFPLQLQGRAR